MGLPRVTWVECLLVGILVFGVAGTGTLLLMLGGLVRLVRGDEGILAAFDPNLAACAATASALVGALAWRLVTVTADAPARRGAWAGLLVGLLSHPLCWLLGLGYQMALEPGLRGQSVYDLVFSLVFMSTWMTLSSLGLVGWITLPLGAALGFLVQRIKNSTFRRV